MPLCKEGRRVPLYDRRLEAIVVAAELGSLSKAAERLSISVPALAKQVSSFEAEHGVTLFDRTRRGVTLTPAGSSLVEDARSLMRQSDDALRRARELAGRGGQAVRLGVSLMCPGRKVLELWPQVHALDLTLRLELVPVGDIYDARLDVVGNLGRDIDLILTSWSPVRWEGRCGVQPMGDAALAIDVPRQSPLATKRDLRVEDLAGVRVHALRHASEGADALRDELAAVPSVEVVDVETYTLGLFNECAEEGGALVTSGSWSGLHPMLVSVPLVPEHRAACALLYARDPAPGVTRFLAALSAVLAG